MVIFYEDRKYQEYQFKFEEEFEAEVIRHICDHLYF